jgi:hypothetical protein
MKYLLTLLVSVFLNGTVQAKETKFLWPKAKETIIILNPQGPSHSGTPQLLALVEESNRIQNQYRFVTEFKPGAFESIALRELNNFPQTRLSTMTNASIESIDRGFINENDVVPVFSQGDSCWAVIGVFNKNIGLDIYKSVQEIVVGGPAIGGATHLAALEIGRKYKIPVRYIVYKSNFDAFIDMVGNREINFILERVQNYKVFKDKNKNLQMVAMSCPRRHPDAPLVKTLSEHGINTPFIWQQIVSNKHMDPARMAEFNTIFTQATRNIGLAKIQQLSDQTPPMFNNVDSKTHYYQSFFKLKAYRAKYANEIATSR